MSPKNEKFQNYVAQVAEQALETSAADIEAFLAEPWKFDTSETVSEALAHQIAPDSGQRPSVRGPETFLPPAPVRSVIAAAASGIRTGRDGHGSAGAHVQSSLVAFVESVVESVVPATVVAGIEASLEVGQRRIIIVVIIAAASAAASIAAPHISFSFYFSCLYYILCGQEGNGSSCHLFPASS